MMFMPISVRVRVRDMLRVRVGVGVGVGLNAACEDVGEYDLHITVLREGRRRVRGGGDEGREG